jgi:hypothetical protein
MEEIKGLKGKLRYLDHRPLLLKFRSRPMPGRRISVSGVGRSLAIAVMGVRRLTNRGQIGSFESSRRWGIDALDAEAL